MAASVAEGSAWSWITVGPQHQNLPTTSHDSKCVIMTGYRPNVLVSLAMILRQTESDLRLFRFDLDDKAVLASESRKNNPILKKDFRVAFPLRLSIFQSSLHAKQVIYP